MVLPDADEDAELAAIIHSPLVEIYAQVHEGRDEGLLELDFRDAGQCELAFFGVTARLIQQRRRPLADEPRAGAVMVAAGRAGLGAPALSITRRRWRSISARAFSPFRRQVENRATIPGSTAPRRAMPRGMFRSSCKAQGYSLPSSPAKAE